MSNLRNSVQLIGYLGIDPEVKELPNGTKMAKVRMATTESYRNKKGEFIDTTYWHSIIGWDFVAERMIKQMKKGLEVAVQGKLTQRSYDDKNGIKRYVTEVRVASFIMLDKAARKNSSTAPLDVAPEKEEAMPF